MTARLRYLIRRVREAPLSVIFEKLLGRLRPWWWYPSYRFFGSRSPSETMLQNFRAFGASLREELALPDSTTMADQALAGEFECLGYGTAPIPDGDGWHCDQFHDHRWPRSYFARCDYVAANSRCDVKVPWELSRLQFLPWLAEAYVATGTDAYLDTYSRFVDDWLDNNPVAFGINWSCPMEAAIRAVNLGASGALLAGDLDAALERRIVASLAEHLRFVERFPETSDVNGNHYLADLMGVSFIAALLFGADSPDTAKRVEEFAGESDQQFESGGCHLERAPVYHRLCLDMHCLVLAVAVRAEQAAVEKLQQTAKRAIEFSIRHSSAGRLPVMGDCDSGQVFWFGEDPRSISTSNSLLVKDRADDDTGQIRWLRAIAGGGQSLFIDIDDAEPPVTGIASGFAHARSGEDVVVVMRAGEQGLQGLASHDHDDALSLWISMAGADLIVEAGCHSYTLSPEQRHRCIVSSAHNVIRPADGERFEPVLGSVFQNVRGAPIATNVTQDTNNGAAAIEAALESGIFRTCTRRVEVSADSVCVEDQWEWCESRSAALSLPLAPGVQASIGDGNVVRLTRDDGFEADLSFQSDVEFSIEIGTYEFSPNYGGSETASSIEVRSPPSLFAALTTRISAEEARP